MTPGQQFRARIGFETLQAEVTYHVVAEDAFNSRVILASFGERAGAIGTHVLSLKRFRDAVAKGLVRLCEPDKIQRLPPWLQNRTDDCLNYSPSLHGGDESELSDDSIISARLDHVLAALDLATTIFAECNFLRALNRLARSRGQHETRFRCWVITYLAFGGNRWTLLPPTLGRGKYDRTAPHPSGKRKGRPDHRGPSFGYDVTPAMQDLMVKGFRKHAGQGKTLTDVYADSIVEPFGCRWVENERQETSIFHPKGDPFPSRGQFDYWVVKLLGHEVVWSTLLGEQGYRTRYKTPEGAYSEGLVDLMEMVYADASTSSEHPRSHHDNEPLPRLQIVKNVDGLSGKIVGVGIAVGGERSALYNQANAIMALPKSLLGELLGIPIRDEDWPVCHMGRAYTTDQGAGSTDNVRDRMCAEGYKGSPNMTPPYTPQSNSPVEATHNRSAPKSGSPTYPVSRKTPIEMAADVVRDIMSKNRAKCVASRLTPAQAAAGIVSPIQLWNDYAVRGRQAGVVMHTNDVITKWVPMVKFTIKQGQLTRLSVIYRSDVLQATPYFKEIFRHEGAELDGWAFDISNRIEWVKVGRDLIKVSPISGVRTRESERAMSAPEMVQHDEAIRAARTRAPQLRSAENVRLRVESLDHTGKKYKSPVQRKGRAKVRTPAHKRQVAALNNS